jgi:Mg2+/citrate symporter
MREKKHQPQGDDFEQAARQGDVGLFREFLGFLMESKKWWLVPLLIAFALVAALVFLGGTGAAPFIYSLF